MMNLEQLLVNIKNTILKNYNNTNLIVKINGLDIKDAYQLDDETFIINLEEQDDYIEIIDFQNLVSNPGSIPISDEI